MGVSARIAGCSGSPSKVNVSSAGVGCHQPEVISACENAAKWEEAIHLLTEMAQSSLRRSTATFNGAISACEKGGQWQRALCLANEVSCSMQSDVVTFSGAISACVPSSVLQELYIYMFPNNKYSCMPERFNPRRKPANGSMRCSS